MIEAGKRYVLRDGRVTESMHVATGAAWAIVGDNRMSWYIDGTHSVHGTSSFDVIREYREPAVHVEVGARYLTLDGAITEPMTDKGAHNDYPFGTKVGNVWYTWAQGGMNSKESAKDLVKVWRNSLELKHGKCYQLRNGDITSPLHHATPKDKEDGYVWEAKVNNARLTWSPKGSWLIGAKDPFDIVSEAQAPEFKIELGKYYLTRSGDVVGPMRREERFSDGILCCEYKGGTKGWWPGGRYYQFEEHKFDLLAEVAMTVHAVSVPVWEDEGVLTPNEVKAVRALIAPKPPRNLDKASVLHFIRTHKRSVLMTAFIFASTPQGYAHWRKIVDGGELTVDDYKYLVSLL